MNKQILNIIDKLESYDLEGMIFSITLNYEKILQDFQKVPYDIETVENVLSSYGKEVETFNLTISNYEKWSEERYKNYWYDANLIFHTGGLSFNFLSPYLSIQYKDFNDIEKMMNVYDEYKKISKKLYDVNQE